MNMEATYCDYYRTSDFPLAVSLAIYVPVCAVDRGDPKRAHFLFERSDHLDRLIEEYHRRELRVDPQLYHLRSKELKSQLYA